MISLSVALGLVLSPAKTTDVATVITTLGLEINLENMTCNLNQKLEKTKPFIENLLEQPIWSQKTLQKLLGKLETLCFCATFGRTHTIKLAKALSIMEAYDSKLINWAKLKSSDLVTFDGILDPKEFAEEVWSELEFWLGLEDCVTDIWRYGRLKASATIYTDASNLRFGIKLEDITIGGMLEPEFEFASIALK